MGWELRGKRMTYYWYCREEGRMRKRYGGRGLAGRAAERHVAEMRVKREGDAQRARDLQTQLAPPTQLADQLDAATAALVHAALKAAGYHCHRNCWRKYRDYI